MGSGAIRYVHTNLIARDWRALARFYTEVFGCAVAPPERHLSGDWIDRMTGIAGVRIDGAHLTLPGYEDGPTLEIFSYEPRRQGDAAQEINRPGFGHLAFHVDDVPGVLEKLLAHGGSMLGEVVQKEYECLGRLTAAYARDPEGNILEIQNWSRP